MEREVAEFSECDKSLKQELGSVERSCLLHASCWRGGSLLVTGSSHFTVIINIFVSEFSEFTYSFRENSIDFGVIGDVQPCDVISPRPTSLLSEYTK